jgi:hypothetical protein
MLVSVKYTIKFDEIPKTTQKSLTEDILPELRILCVELEGIGFRLSEGRDQNIFKALQELDKIRQGLILADAKLSDCYDILEGYQREILKPALQEPHSPTTEELLSKLQDTTENIENAEG